MMPLYQKIDARQFAIDIFSWLLPVDFPPSYDRSFGDEEIADLAIRAQITDTEAIALWCYLTLATRLEPEIEEQARIILPLFALRPAHHKRATTAMNRLFKELRTRPSAGDLIRTPPPQVVQAITELAAACMAELSPAAINLLGLQPDAFEHPQALNLLAAIKRVPILPELTAAAGDFVRRGVEVEILASSILVTNASLPWLHDCLETACQALDVRDMPRLYVRTGGLAVYTIGMDDPAVVVESIAVSVFDKNEMVFLLGRELGHILAGHTKYLSLTETLISMAGIASNLTVGIGGPLIDSTLGLQLYRWARYAEYSADRAGYLACQNREAVLRTFCKLAGFPIRYQRAMRTRALIEQAESFRARLDDSVLDKMFSLMGRLALRVPLVLPRTLELLDWDASGKYAQVLGEYA